MEQVLHRTIPRNNSASGLSDTCRRDDRNNQDNYEVELFISCTELKDMDVFSKTDPMGVLYVKQYGKWREFGRTEVLQDTLNPKFTETFLLDFDPDLQLPLRLMVYDIDSSSHDLNAHELVGSVDTRLSDLLRDEHDITTTTRSLRISSSPKPRGNIHLTTERVATCRGKLHMQLSGGKLDKKGFLNLTKVSTYVEVCRQMAEGESYHPVYRTEVFNKSQKPLWRSFDINIQKICNGDLERPVKLVCWMTRLNKEPKMLGHSTISIKEITDYRGTLIQSVKMVKTKSSLKRKATIRQTSINFSEHSAKSSKRAGFVHILQCRLDLNHTLLDYIKGGCKLKFITGVDFTSSNGNPKESTSLHSLRNGKTNEYIEAITTLATVLGFFDLDQSFTAYGFGAKLSKGGPVHYCFPLNGKQDDPHVLGVKGILSAYKSILRRLVLAGPSKVAPLLKEIISQVRRTPLTQKEQIYYVILIVTDGVINDMDDLLQQLVIASELPLSIVIVGVGPADFSNMEQLHNGEETPLKCPVSGRTAERCNVHFAALRKHKYATGTNHTVAREILAKVSKQCLTCMQTNHIVPNSPRHKPNTHPHLPWSETNGREQLNFTSQKNGFTSSLKPSKSINNLKPVHGEIHTGSSCPTCGADIHDHHQRSLPSLTHVQTFS